MSAKKITDPATKRTFSLTPAIFITYLVFVVAYALLTLLPEPSKTVLAHYNLSTAHLRIIEVTIIIIEAAIWFAGFYGYSRLRRYSKSIRKEKDGKQVAKLSVGVFLLVMWLPVTSILSAAFNIVTTNHPGSLATTTIISNYVNLVIPLAGFIFISYGAHGLSKIIPERPNFNIVQAIALFLIYIGLAYYHLVASTGQRSQVYHLSFWVITLTLVAPYIYMWTIGLLSAYEIYRYTQKVSGIVYKRSWLLLALGIGWLIVTSIAFQYLTSLSAHLLHLRLRWLLAIVYGLLLLLGIGFVLIAMGARKLQKIEDVV